MGKEEESAFGSLTSTKICFSSDTQQWQKGREDRGLIPLRPL
jgi:hypothetical protein